MARAAGGLSALSRALAPTLAVAWTEKGGVGGGGGVGGLRRQRGGCG